MAAFHLSISIGFLFLALVGWEVRADSLEEFEWAATKKDQGSERRKPIRSHRYKDDDDELDNLLLDMVLAPFEFMARSSLERIHGSGRDSGFGYTKRLPHDRDIPTVELSAAYQSAEDSIYGVETKAELGYGPAAVRYRNIHYKQDVPSGVLDVSHYHLLLRGSFQVFQVNLGLGQAVLDGIGRNSGHSQLAELIIIPTKRAEFGTSYIRSEVNGNEIHEYEGYAGVGVKGFALRAGYRLSEVGGSEIQGPYIGLAWRY